MSSSAQAKCPHCPVSERLFSVPHGLRVHIGRMHKNITSNGKDTSIVIPGPSEPCVFLSPVNSTGIQLNDLPSLKARIRVLRHVPTGARCLAAGKLSHLIDGCVQSNSTADWLALMTFAYTALRLPNQSGKVSLTTKVKDNVERAQVEWPSEEVPRKSSSVYKSVQAKVYEGDLRGASRLLTSDCTFAAPGEDTLASLKKKHPTPSSSDAIPLPDSSISVLSVKVEDVSAAIHSFYRGSAAGMDGLRPEHLKELVSASAGNNGPRLLESLTRLCNFLLAGKLNPDICPYLYGGSLCALKKKDGGIRPIAVGNTLRRLVAKLCCQSVKAEMTSYLQPQQVGFGTPLGCEASIHATRAFIMREGSEDVIIKLDLRNAFNSVDRRLMLAEVKELTPAISPFLWQCYSAPSYLSYEGECILSQVGAQQGDPLGPLLFSMAIHKAIKTLQSPMNIWYLDDGTLGGSPEVVLRDVKSLFPTLKTLGLEVNTSKCEFFPCSPSAADSFPSFESLIPGLRSMTRESLYLLGAPLFAEGVQESLHSKTQVLTSLSRHFQNLPAHVCLTLLRSCFAMPKLAYVIRTAPTWKNPEEVKHFDDTLKMMVEEILNVNLNETQWLQASLPIRFGGLGVRRLQEYSPIAFLASSYGASGLVAKILQGCSGTKHVPFVREASAAWSLMYPESEVPSRPQHQRNWDEISGKHTMTRLLRGALGADLARLHAASKSESGAWLHALPSPHLGTLLDDDSLRVAVGLRLGCAVCEPHKCACGAMVGADGHHGLGCTRCEGRRPRHHAINEVIRRALIAADIPSALEPPGLSRSDGKRPDGLTLVPWRRGRCLIWDATCVSTFASSHLASTQRVAGAAAETAARTKHTKYSALESAYEFVPFAVETAGPWGSEAKKFVAELGKRLQARGRDPRSGSFLTQQISLAIQRGNAAGLMGTFGPRNIGTVTSRGARYTPSD